MDITGTPFEACRRADNGAQWTHKYIPKKKEPRARRGCTIEPFFEEGVSG